MYMKLFNWLVIYHLKELSLRRHGILNTLCFSPLFWSSDAVCRHDAPMIIVFMI